MSDETNNAVTDPPAKPGRRRAPASQGTAPRQRVNYQSLYNNLATKVEIARKLLSSKRAGGTNDEILNAAIDLLE